MAFIHNVEISWNDLLDAFTRVTTDRIYFLDRFTGDIFFVPASMEDEDFWERVENNNERFLEIPAFDRNSEKRIMTRFMEIVKKPELKKMLQHAISGKKPYCTVSDILSFFPEEHDHLMDIKENFVTLKVKNWLEANEIFTMETNMIGQSSYI